MIISWKTLISERILFSSLHENGATKVRIIGLLPRHIEEKRMTRMITFGSLLNPSIFCYPGIIPTTYCRLRQRLVNKDLI